MSRFKWRKEESKNATKGLNAAFDEFGRSKNNSKIITL